ncbi:N-acetylmuramidase family protein [Novosphingobium sp.]|uniref:N-acetylmuramidase family protein n=1 Tax=Novosphingobium sp. TaxID=1874826 RepID=UPI0038B80DEA
MDEQLAFEQKKWADELELRKLEAELKAKEASPSLFKNPIAVTVLSAIVAGIISVITNYVDSTNKIALEERKSDLNLLTNLIQVKDQNLIRKNLEFVVKAKIIRNDKLRDDLDKYLKSVSTSDLPAITSQLITKENVAAFDICKNVGDKKYSVQFVPLTDQDIAGLASEFSLDKPTIQAFIKVENASGRLPDGRPKILYERHIFNRLTTGKFLAANPALANPVAGGYLGGAAEYSRVQQAANLDCDAALSATSWGTAQILGREFKRAGFDNVQSFAKAMLTSEPDTLRANLTFVQNAGAIDALRNHDWAQFARQYNGPIYARFGYDKKLDEAFKSYSNQ